METRLRIALIAMAAGIGLAGVCPAASSAAPGFTTAFEDAADLGPTGRNPYFVLEPGWVLVLEGNEDGKPVRIENTVLPETRVLDGVTVRVVREVETVGGKVKEDTRDYYAISKRTNSVYYFGEDVDEYEGGKVTGHGGSWLSGVAGAKFGLMMPGLPLLGARYQQETAPGVAMDRAEIVALDETFETPAGKFSHCLETSEGSALEPGLSPKHYAPGVGMIQDSGLKLVKYGSSGKTK